MISKIIYEGQAFLWSLLKKREIKNHKLDYLFWECTLRCNFFCKHCGSSVGRGITPEHELSTEEIESAFKDVASNFDASKIMLAITGGEPLIREDIFEVMEYAHGLGFNWGMVTNGSLVTPEIVEKMKQSGMATIVVSIDGLRETHDDFRMTPGSYDKATTAIELLAKAKFLKDLQITSTIHPANIDQLEEMYKEFSPLGISSWRLINSDPIGRAENNADVLLNKKQLTHLLNFIKEKNRKSKINITFGCNGFIGSDYECMVRPHFFFCCTGITTGSILHNGDIFVCPNTPRRPELIQGNIRQDSFSEAWKNKFKIFRDPDRTSCKECKECEHWNNCKGDSFHTWDFDKGRPKACFLKDD